MDGVVVIGEGEKDEVRPAAAVAQLYNLNHIQTMFVQFSMP
jgi:fructose-1,6-bisphosphatase/sedoheptulose 1,7-bisphosphatase-like protein